MLWLGAPIGWLYVGSQVQAKSESEGFGPYLLVIGGIAVSVVVLTKVLSALSRAYDRASGQDEPVRVRLPWHRSMRGDDDHRPPQEGAGRGHGHQRRDRRGGHDDLVLLLRRARRCPSGTGG